MRHRHGVGRDEGESHGRHGEVRDKKGRNFKVVHFTSSTRKSQHVALVLARWGLEIRAIPSLEAWRAMKPASGKVRCCSMGHLSS